MLSPSSVCDTLYLGEYQNVQVPGYWIGCPFKEKVNFQNNKYNIAIAIIIIRGSCNTFRSNKNTKATCRR